MGSPQPRANDLGILYSKNGSPAGATYVDVAGVTQLVGTLTTAYTEQVTVPLGIVDYSHPWVGARDAISLFVVVTLSASTDIRVKLQGRYDNSGAWADIQLVREDTGLVLAEHVFTAAGTFAVQTSSILAVPQIRIVSLATGAPAVGDSVVVKAWVQ
jgi:hypothetical protein